MNMDLKYVSQFKNVIEDIVDVKIKNTGITKYIAAIVQKINDDGTVDVYLPPDKQNIITGIFNRCGELLFVGDSVEIATKNGSLTNAWVFVKHGTNIQGYSEEINQLGTSVVMKVSNGRLVTSTLAQDAALGNSLTVIADDINLDGYNIVLNGTRGITISSPYFNVTRTGRITSTSGKIGGWEISSTKLYSGSGASYVGLDSGTSGESYSIWCGSATSSSAPFRVTRKGAVTASDITITGGSLSIGSNFSVSNAGHLEATGADISGTITTNNITVTGGTMSIGNNFDVDSSGNLKASNVTLSGQITASSGKIAGYTIDGDTLYGSQVGMDAESGGHYAFWAGASVNNSGNAPFRVGHDGSLVATNATITGNVTATSGSFTGSVTATSGTFSNVTINDNCTINGTFDASKITSGTFDSARIPNLSAGKITSGTMSANRINGGSISGVSININNVFSVNSSGGTQISNNTGFFSISRGTDHPYVSAMNVATGGGGIAFVTGTTQSSVGSAFASLIGSGSNLVINANGSVYCGGSGSGWEIATKSGGYPSSRNLKTNLKNIENEYDNIYRELKNINMYDYEYKYDGIKKDKRDFGFVIDELEDTEFISKYIVNYERKGKIVDNKLIKYLKSEEIEGYNPIEEGYDFDYKDWDRDSYFKMSLILIKALQYKIDELEKEVKYGKTSN